jgi:Ser/Thr protein kinase RdoA (MazF antagonist)
MEEGAPVVVKFYRPERWSDAAILEEHAFVQELAEREIPVVPADTIAGRTLHHFGGFRFAVFPRRGGRAPELDDPDTLEWTGRFIGRIHAVGALAAYGGRPALDLETFGREPRDYLLAHDFLPPELAATWKSVAARRWTGWRAAMNGPARRR